jgi:protocatechuate 4,5-dioxygenase, alpha chain
MEAVMLDEVAGTPVFTGERAHAGYPLNRMAMSLTDAANRAAFVADETAYLRGMGLDDATIDIVLRRDWKAMIGVPLYAVGAQTAGMTLDEFMATRKGR